MSQTPNKTLSDIEAILYSQRIKKSEMAKEIATAMGKPFNRSFYQSVFRHLSGRIEPGEAYMAAYTQWLHFRQHE